MQRTLLSRVGILSTVLILAIGGRLRAQDLIVVEQAQLVDPTPTAVELFGRAVAIDGDRAIVAAPGNGTGGVFAGAVFVLARQGILWTIETELVAPDAANFDQAGWNGVALDGDTVAVGVPLDDDAGSSSGSVHVFVKNSTGWSPAQKLTASDAGAGHNFGWDVALQGNVIVVGATLADSGISTSTGAVYVFRSDGVTWVEEQKLVGSDIGALDGFGQFVAFDGATILVGAPYHALSDEGAAYVFRYDGAVWNQEQKLVPLDAATDDQFGFAGALDGERAVVGAPFDDPAGSNSGSAYVFHRNGTVWTQEDKLAPADGVTGDWFGRGAALSGNLTLVSAPRNDAAAADGGAAYAFQRQGSQWFERAKLTATDAAIDDRFGSAVALDDDTAVLGAPEHDQGLLADAGAAYVVLLREPPVVYCTGSVNSQGCRPRIAGWTGYPSASDTSPFRIVSKDELNNKAGIFFYGLAGRATIPFWGGVLCALPPLKRTPPQSSGGHPPPDDCSGSYQFDFNQWFHSGSGPNLGPDVQVNGQFWSRDPLGPTGAVLTDAIEFVIVP